jgi:mannose-1-phosphate guanylyltransferase/mannose-6-phosphate isomerase
MSKIIPVILSGGSGTRLWPLSRKKYPKQYLPLNGSMSMLQETILRLDGINNMSNPMIICNVEHRFLVAEQCKEVGIISPIILLEPVGRNTAPAIAAAALHSSKDFDESILLVLSADHVIKDIDAFHAAINIATNQAKKGNLVTFGIVPTDANTGYGYIKSAKKNNDGSHDVEEFLEKPDLQTALSLFKQGGFFWNAGMFMFKTNAVIEALSKHAPDIIEAIVDAVDNAKQDFDFIRLDKKAFELSPSDSIDYALMEKSKNVVVVPLDANWSDIGSWKTLYNISQKDKNGNVTKGDVTVKDTFNSYIYTNNHMVTTIGVDNLIVVNTDDATLIASIDKVAEVKSIVEELQSLGRKEISENLKVYRPWGWYDSIETGRHFQVKRLHVNPGAQLSLQLHHKRAEHWVVVAGRASIVNGEETITLSEGESTYIAIGVKHSLENKENMPLEVIEIQSGTYLGEDDIVRFQDKYGRT